MKDIVARTSGDAKLRLRGKGSGFKERDTQNESPEPLQLCISCPNGDSYDIAVQCTRDLLTGIYSEYNEWCSKNNRPVRPPELRMSERHLNDGGSGGGGGMSESAGGSKNRRRGGRNRKGKNAAVDAAVAAAEDDDDDDDSSEADGGLPLDRGYGGGGGGKEDTTDRGPRPENSPSPEEIERLIEDRNRARKESDFRGADRIRDDLRNRGVVLSDEKGAHGQASRVTSWRYWKE